MYFYIPQMKTKVFPFAALLLFCLGGCSDTPWNSPYPESNAGKKIYYSSFSERPKHLDPATSYSEDEALFIGQIYEPPLQYHFLKRPYQLVPLSATEVPQPVYYDADGHRLPDKVTDTKVARAVYTIHIKPGRYYQPHPAFARDKNGRYLYHHLDASDVADIHSLNDFPKTGSRELVARDFVYEIKRLVKPGIQSPLAGLMSRYIAGLGDLGKRLHEAARHGPVDLRDFDFEGARVVDRYTYQIVLNQKYPQFIYWLSMNFFAPVPWEADAFYDQPGMKENNISLDWYPVGTGPYMLTENNPNRHMILKRNPNFAGETYPTEGEPGDREAGYLEQAGQSLPFIDEAYYSLEKESIPAWNKFLQGYYDTSGVLSDSFDQAIQFGSAGEPELTPAMQKKGISLQTAVQPSIWYLGFNMNDSVVGGDSKRARLLRRAISIAVDYEEYISIFANGRGIPAQGPIPPGIAGSQQGRAGINPYVYDWVNGQAQRKPLSKARELMKEAGYDDGRNVRTGDSLILYYDTVSAGAGSKSVLNWYRKQFGKLGIQLVIRATDYNRFQEKMREGTEQMFSWGWNADYPDPENFLFLLYGGNTKVEHGGENAANYHNDEYDKLFMKMRAMDPGPERNKVITRMVDILQRDAPWDWGYYPVAYSLYHSWYGNAKPNLMARNTLKYKTIDPRLRQKKRREWNQPVLWPVILLGVVLLLSVIPAVITYRRRQRAAVQ